MAHNLDSLRAVAHAARSIPGAMDMRRYSVHVVTRTWSGSEIGDGAHQENTTELLEAGYPPKLREMRSEELALAGLESAAYEIGPITPEYTHDGVTAGTAFSTLKPTIYDNVTEFYYLISGGEFGDGMRCRVETVDHSKPLRYMVQVVPAEQRI